MKNELPTQLSYKIFKPIKHNNRKYKSKITEKILRFKLDFKLSLVR